MGSSVGSAIGLYGKFCCDIALDTLNGSLFTGLPDSGNGALNRPVNLIRMVGCIPHIIRKL